jgi:hypothetical protein
MIDHHPCDFSLIPCSATIRLLSRRYVDNRLGELVGVARAFGMGHGLFLDALLSLCPRCPLTCGPLI